MTNAARLITAANRWRDGYNPLRALTMPRAVALMEEAQRGVMADLQWLYASELGIEATDGDLMTIIEKTLAGVADMDWQIVVADADSRGFDKSLADEQKDFLESAYNACDNLPEAIEHLVMARFRGFSHLQPWLKPDWTIEHLEPLPQWNMVRDGTSSRWAWNPEAHQKPYRAFGADALLSPDDYIILENRRPVNRIALVKYIRSTIAEKDWDAYVEIYGIPGVFIIMPPHIPQGQEGKYRDEAVAASEAASGALPNGSDVKTLSEVRGVQPFQTRLEWLQKQLILAGTGGMLTSLAEPTGIGGGASGVQENAWTTIVRRVAHKVESAIVRQYDRRALAARFPGRPALASFALRTKQEKDVGAAVESISKLAAAGYQVDPDQVEAETGYKVTLKPVADPSQGQFAALNSAVPRKTPLQTNEKPLQNAPSDPDGQGDPSGQPPAQIAKNRPPGAEAVLAEIAATILDGSVPYEEALKAAREKLEKIDPAILADDLEKELENAMFKAAAEVATGGEARNSNPDQPRGQPDNAGQFASTGGGSAAKKDSPTKPAADKADATGDSGSSGASAEAANYTAEHREKVGQSGDWKSLGLPPLRDITPDEPRGNGKTKIADAKNRIEAGEKVTSPLGDELSIDNRTIEHWLRTKKSAADIAERLQSLDEAETTIKNPHEIWQGGGRHKGTSYIRMVKSSSGRYVLNVAEMKDGVVSWHTNDAHYDFWRKGTLLYVR